MEEWKIVGGGLQPVHTTLKSFESWRCYSKVNSAQLLFSVCQV